MAMHTNHRHVYVSGYAINLPRCDYELDAGPRNEHCSFTEYCDSFEVPSLWCLCMRTASTTPRALCSTRRPVIGLCSSVSCTIIVSPCHSPDTLIGVPV